VNVVIGKDHVSIMMSVCNIYTGWNEKDYKLYSDDCEHIL